MDIKKELSANQTVLLIMSGLEYNKEIVSVMKKLKGNVCYVTTNKTSDSLRELFKKNKVDTKSVVFIDAITKTIRGVPDQGEGVYYISSPGALTELSLAIEKFLRHDFDYLVFDSITNLSVYQDKNQCTRFVLSLINKIKQVKTKSVLYALSVKEQEEIIKESGSMVDKVIEL